MEEEIQMLEKEDAELKSTHNHIKNTSTCGESLTEN